MFSSQVTVMLRVTVARFVPCDSLTMMRVSFSVAHSRRMTFARSIASWSDSPQDSGSLLSGSRPPKHSYCEGGHHYSKLVIHKRAYEIPSCSMSLEILSHPGMSELDPSPLS